VAYNQKSLNKLVKEGLNINLQNKTRIKALQSAAELMTNSKPDSSIILLDLANKLNEKVGELTLQQSNHLIRAKTLLIQGVYPIALEYTKSAEDFRGI
jgi:tryptophanyl-tRNA synthetase